MLLRAFSCVVAVLVVLADVDADQAITVGPNVLVSAERPRQEHWELQIATDPTDSRRLIACAMMLNTEQNELRTINYLSTDEGRTWKTALEVDGGMQSGDPVCGFGADGTVYAISLTDRLEENKRQRNMIVHRSSDHGQRWDAPQRLRFIDRQYLTVDLTGGPRHGRLYIHGTDVLRSLDGELASGLAVFGARQAAMEFVPVQAMTSGARFIEPMGNGVVLSNGTFALVFGQWKEGDRSDYPAAGRRVTLLSMVRSPDGGSTLERTTITDRWVRCDASRPGAVASMPYLAADASGGPFADRLYVVYPEGSHGRCNIALTYSTDRGRTWSSPTIVNDDQPRDGNGGPDHGLPAVAVNKSGVVGVTWLDRREDPKGQASRLRFAASFDGADTFTPSVRVSDSPNVADWKNPMGFRLWEFGGASPWRPRPDVVQLALGQGGGFSQWSGGDTTGIATGGAGEFHTTWVDNRSSVMQVWTSRVTAAGVAQKNGSHDLAELDDITADSAVEATNVSYDPTDATIAFDLAVRNVSLDARYAPLKIRVVNIASAYGVATVLDSDNALVKGGALWDMTPTLTAGSLAPNQTSGKRRVRVKLTDRRALEPPPEHAPLRDIVRIEAKVLAKTSNATR